MFPLRIMCLNIWYLDGGTVLGQLRNVAKMEPHWRKWVVIGWRP